MLAAKLTNLHLSHFQYIRNSKCLVTSYIFYWVHSPGRGSLPVSFPQLLLLNKCYLSFKIQLTHQLLLALPDFSIVLLASCGYLEILDTFLGAVCTWLNLQGGPSFSLKVEASTQDIKNFKWTNHAPLASSAFYFYPWSWRDGQRGESGIIWCSTFV